MLHHLILSVILMTHSHPQPVPTVRVAVPSHQAVVALSQQSHIVPRHKHRVRHVVKTGRGLWGNITRDETIISDTWTWQVGPRVYQKQVYVTITKNYKAGVYQNTVTVTSTRLTYKISGQPRVHVYKTRHRSINPPPLPKPGHTGFSTRHHYNPKAKAFSQYQGVGFWRI